MNFCCKNNDKKSEGFTLAEILVVITIIGVVAMQTIPTLVAQINRNQTITRYKKTYSILSQASIQVKEEMGGKIYFPATYNWSGDPFFKDQFKKYLRYVKEYNPGANNWKLIGSNGYFETVDGQYTTFDNIISASTNSPALVLIDGTVLYFNEWGSEYWAGTILSLNYVGFDLIVDFNGSKPPNYFGKDIFIFGVGTDGTLGIAYNRGRQCGAVKCEDLACDPNKESYLGYNCGQTIMTNQYNLN